MHDFAESLERSHFASDLPIWEFIYRRAFPGFTAMIDHRQDGEHQRAGIDRSVILANSKQILIDEKVRWRNRKTGEVYDDIALEYWSDEGRRIPGWVCKPLRADYIAYAIAPLGKAYMLPVLQLQVAWAQFGDYWIAKYPYRIKAHNRDGRSGRSWDTISVGVPVKEVFSAVGAALRITFEPVDE